MNLPKDVTTAKTAMLIRRPVAEVFDAFTNPGVTTRFWFTKSTGPLKQGETVEWTWEMYSVTDSVYVKVLRPNDYIEFEWGTKDESSRSTVTLQFEKVDESSTFVSVSNYGFAGDVEKVVASVSDSVSGFALVLAGLKAYLEFNIELGLIADRFPNGKGL